LKKLQLPEPDQFQKFIEEVENSGSGFSKPCADLVRFLAYGGFRIKEARHVLWADCDFKRGSITVRGEPETGTKGTGDPRVVPMIPDMRTLLDRLRAEGKNTKPTDPVMRVHECQKSMNRAAKAVGMPRITHHDLRHLLRRGASKAAWTSRPFPAGSVTKTAAPSRCGSIVICGIRTR